MVSLGGAWFSSGQSDSQTQAVVKEVSIDSSVLPTIKNEEGEDVLRMYWLDAYEDAYQHPGTVWLFGKVWVGEASIWASCCLTVKTIPRWFILRKFLSVD